MKDFFLLSLFFFRVVVRFNAFLFLKVKKLKIKKRKTGLKKDKMGGVGLMVGGGRKWRRVRGRHKLFHISN